MKLTTVTELADKLGLSRREIQRRAGLLQIPKRKIDGFARLVYQFNAAQCRLIDGYPAKWRRKQKGNI
jgi:hypothetical protein